MNCLLPEIAMKRYLARREINDIREPQYILDAQEAKKQREIETAQRARDRALRGARGGRGAHGDQGAHGAGQDRIGRVGHGRRNHHSPPHPSPPPPTSLPPRFAKGGGDQPPQFPPHIEGALDGAQDQGPVDLDPPESDPPPSPLPSPPLSPPPSPPCSPDPDLQIPSPDPPPTSPAPDRWNVNVLSTKWHYADYNERMVLTAEIAPDGACLFGSLAHQLYGFRPGSGIHQRKTIQVREEIANYIEKHYNDFEPGLVDILAERGEKYKKYIRRGKVVNPTKAFKSFVSDLKNDLTFFGSNECLAAATNLYKITIQLHQTGKERPLITLAPEGDVSYSVVHLLFQREAKHYSSVVQVNGDKVFSPDT